MKQQLIGFGALTIITAGLVTLAVASNHPKQTVAAPNYKALYTGSQQQVTVLTKQKGVLQAENNQLTTQKTALCQQLAAAKLKQPVCQ